MKKQWEKINDPNEIISKLQEYQNAFVDILTTKNHSSWTEPVHQCFVRLQQSGIPTSTLPFLMRVGHAVSSAEIADKNAVGLLTAIEGFLVRRAICGIEPTGLHAVFRRLWSDLNKEYTQEKLAEVIVSHKTVTWPDDTRLEEAIDNRALYGTTILPFLVREYDRSLGGDVPTDVPWIEHVLPQKMNDEWRKDFTEKEHQALHNTWANLIPLSARMDQQLQNKSYDLKRNVFSSDAMYKSSRTFSNDYATWTPAEIKDRSEKLKRWARGRWPALIISNSANGGRVSAA